MLGVAEADLLEQGGVFAALQGAAEHGVEPAVKAPRALVEEPRRVVRGGRHGTEGGAGFSGCGSNAGVAGASEVSVGPSDRGGGAADGACDTGVLRAGMVRPDQDRIGGRANEHVEVDETGSAAGHAVTVGAFTTMFWSPAPLRCAIGSPEPRRISEGMDAMRGEFVLPSSPTEAESRLVDSLMALSFQGL